jgi:hypothetical protein
MSPYEGSFSSSEIAHTWRSETWKPEEGTKTNEKLNKTCNYESLVPYVPSHMLILYCLQLFVLFWFLGVINNYDASFIIENDNDIIMRNLKSARYRYTVKCKIAVVPTDRMHRGALRVPSMCFFNGSLFYPLSGNQPFHRKSNAGCE